jgi:Tfp pilus assembly protein PilW
MLVAIVVALILVAGIIQLLISNKQAYRLQEGFSMLNENGRFALQQLAYGVRMGAHWGGVSPDEVIDASDPANPVPAGPGIRGYQGGNNPPAGTVIPPADYVTNSDVIELRFATAETLDSATLVAEAAQGQNGLWLRSSVGRRAMVFRQADFDIHQIQSPDLFGADEPGINNYRFTRAVYFVRRCSNRAANAPCGAGNDNIPTLVRLTDPNDANSQEPVVEGVEQMWARYGVDSDGDHSADEYRCPPAIAAADWARVVSVELSLLVRNPELDIAFTDTTTYARPCPGGNYVPPAAHQHYKRRLLNSVIQVRNTVRQ